MNLIFNLYLQSDDIRDAKKNSIRKPSSPLTVECTLIINILVIQRVKYIVIRF